MAYLVGRAVSRPHGGRKHFGNQAWSFRKLPGRAACDNKVAVLPHQPEPHISRAQLIRVVVLHLLGSTKLVAKVGDGQAHPAADGLDPVVESGSLNYRVAVEEEQQCVLVFKSSVSFNIKGRRTENRQ